MADLNFPLNPQVNDLYTFNSKTFKYDGSKWRYVNVTLVTVTSGTAVTSINSLSNSAQDFAVGVSGSGFNVASTGNTHTFNIPIAGSGSTGLITGIGQTIAGAKTFSSDLLVSSSTASTNTTTGALSVSGGAAIGGSINVAGRINLWNSTNYTSFVSSASGNTVYTLPATSPATGTSVLQSDTAGVLSWVPMTATSSSSSGGTVSSGTQYQIAGYYSGTGASVAGSSTFVNNTAIGQVQILHTTASTGTSTGALQVAGGVGISGRLSFNQASFGTTGIATNPTMAMIGQTGDPIYMSVLEDNSISFEGTQGQLFSITPNLSTGYIYSVNDITGIPLFRANANANITSNEYAGNFGIGLTNPGYKLHVLGSVGFTSTTASTSTTTGTLVVSGGVGIGGSLYVASATGISGVTINNGVVTGNLTGTATTAGFATTASYALQSGYGITAGLATTANSLSIVSTTSNSNHRILFTPASGTSSGAAVSSETSFVYNPFTDILSVSGLAITSGTASTNSSSGALVVTGGVGIGGSLYVAGDLTINGTTTTINTVTLTVDDKNIELGSVVTPSDITAEGGGITLKGATDKSINWYTGTGWSSSESWNLVSGNTYKINNTTVLSNSSLGTGVTNSSLTAVGTITTGTWAGTLITSFYGGTGYNSYSKGDLLVGVGNTLVKLPVGNDLTILTASSSAGSGLSWKGLLSPTYGAFGSTATQPVSAANTETLVSYNLTYEANNVSIGSGTTTRVYINDSGVFNIQFSAQLGLSSGVQPSNVDMWFKINGTNVPQSNTRQTIAGKDKETIFALNFVSTFISGQYIELAFSSADANMQLGGFSGLTLPTRPDIPSMILTVTPVSSILPGSGLAITGLASLNLLTSNAQTLSTGTSGVDFNISSVGSVHTFNIPDASTTARGLITTGSQTLLGAKTFGSGISITATTASTSTSSGALIVSGGVGIGGSLNVASATAISGVTINAGIITGSLAGTATTATNVNVVAASSNTFHRVLFTPASGSASGAAVSTESSFVYNPSTDILTISGLAVTSSTASTTTTTGALISTGGVGIGQSISVGGRLQMFNGANYTAFVSSASGNTVYTLPATSPATGSSVLQSTSAGVLSWVAMTASGGIAVSGGTDGMIQYKVGSGLGATLSLFFNPLTLGLRVSGFPGGEIPTSTDAALKLEATVGSFNGSVNGTYYAANAPTGFAGDLMNLQVNAVSKFRIDNTGAIIQNIGTNATNTTSGSVQVRGGVGITGAVFVGESINATSITTSTSTTSGSLIVSGGAGIAGTINLGGTQKIFSSTASTNTWTGALTVGGGVGISGQLTFAQASLGFTGITSNPSMSFIGNTSSSPITLTVLTDNSLNFEGSQGSVFSIDSNLSTGEIFSVSDISGLPIISASAGQTVTFNEFGGYTQFGNGTINSSSTSTGAVVIAGGLGMTGNANFGGTVLISNTTQPAYGSTTSGALVVTGGVGIGGSVYIGGQLGVGGTLDYNASGNVSYFAGSVNSYNQVIVHNHSNGNAASSDFVVSNDSTTDTTFFGDFGMNSSGWAATTSAFNTANAVYLASNSGDLAIGTLTTNPIRFFYNNGTSDAAVFGGTAATVNYGTNASSTTSGALQVKGGLGITGNAFIGGTTSITNTTASVSSSSGALTVAGGAGIGQSLFVGGNIVVSNNIYSGGNNFAKAGQAPGDIIFDNNSNDTAGVLYYYKNNTNFGLDVYAVGTGSTRFRIVKDLNESGGSELWSIDRNGVVTRTGWDIGEVISTRVYNNTDLNMQATNTIGITSYVSIATITYTPKSSSSYLWIEFDAHYDCSGTTADDYFSRITVAGSTIMEKNQIFINGPGGGTRSGVLFPISGRYTNTSTSGIAITVQARRGTADDDLRVFGSSTSGYMRIQEIGR